MSEWRYVDAPNLRIVSDQQWALVEARYAAFDGTVRKQARRPKRFCCPR
jgi:hypothetical protein